MVEDIEATAVQVIADSGTNQMVEDTGTTAVQVIADSMTDQIVMDTEATADRVVTDSETNQMVPYTTMAVQPKELVFVAAGIKNAPALGKRRREVRTSYDETSDSESEKIPRS